MMSGDNLDSARSESESYADDRVEHRWDPERKLGEVFAKRLGLRGVGRVPGLPGGGRLG